MDVPSSFPAWYWEAWRVGSEGHNKQKINPCQYFFCQRNKIKLARLYRRSLRSSARAMPGNLNIHVTTKGTRGTRGIQTSVHAGDPVRGVIGAVGAATNGIGGLPLGVSMGGVALDLRGTWDDNGVCDGAHVILSWESFDVFLNELVGAFAALPNCYLQLDFLPHEYFHSDSAGEICTSIVAAAMALDACHENDRLQEVIYFYRQLGGDVEQANAAKQPWGTRRGPLPKGAFLEDGTKDRHGDRHKWGEPWSKHMSHLGHIWEERACWIRISKDNDIGCETGGGMIIPLTEILDGIRRFLCGASASSDPDAVRGSLENAVGSFLMNT